MTKTLRVTNVLKRTIDLSNVVLVNWFHDVNSLWLVTPITLWYLKTFEFSRSKLQQASRHLVGVTSHTRFFFWNKSTSNRSRGCKTVGHRIPLGLSESWKGGNSVFKVQWGGLFWNLPNFLKFCPHIKGIIETFPNACTYESQCVYKFFNIIQTYFARFSSFMYWELDSVGAVGAAAPTDFEESSLYNAPTVLKS